MSFAVEINKPVPAIITMLSIRPRVRHTDWVSQAVVSMNVYTISWTRGIPLGLYDESFETLEEKESAAEVDAEKGTWFFDPATNVIRANFFDAVFDVEIGGIPTPNQRCVSVEWDMFFSTQRLNWFKDPMSNQSGDQVWEPGMQKPPVPQQGNPDLIFGFSPVRVSDVALVVGEESEVMEYLHDWSLFGSRVKIWQCAGPLAIENISEFFTGVADTYALENGILTITVTDPLNLVNQTVEGDTFNSTDFPNLDPAMRLKAIRQVFGCVEGYVPVNVDYLEAPALNVNRDWVVRKGSIAASPVLDTEIVVGAPENDFSNSKVVDASGFRVGDNIVIDVNGTPNYEIRVIAVNYTTNVIQHSTILGRTVVAGDSIRRGFCGNVSITANGSTIVLAYERDWTEIDMANDTVGIVLTDDFEANFGAPFDPFDPTTQQIYCTVYGPTTTPKKLNGTDPLCGVAENGGAVANPVGAIWNILRDEVRTFRELVSFDEDSWVTTAAEIERTVGYAVPLTSTADFPTWKTVLQSLLQSELLRLHIQVIDGLAKLSIIRDKPMSTADAELTQNQIVKPTWLWSYSDTYELVSIGYNQQEARSTVFSGGGSFDGIQVTARVGKYLHRVSGTYSMDTYHYEQAHALEIAQRLAAIVGERRGTLTGIIPPSQMARKLGDTIEFYSKFLPGAAIDGQNSERPFKLIRHGKGPGGIAVTLDDQKGIEDFGGTW